MIERKTKQWLVVLRTYYHLPKTLILFGIGLLFMALFSKGDSPESFVLWIGVYAFAPLTVLLPSVMEQFAHPRAKLMPHFAAAHLGILGVLLFLLLCIYPMAACWLSDRPMLGFVSFAAIVGALYLWQEQTARPTVRLVAKVLLFSLAGKFYIDRFSVSVWFDSNPSLFPFQLVAFLAGWIGIIFWLRQVPQAAEEVTRVPLKLGIQGWLTDRWLEKIARRTIKTNLDRQRILRYGMSSTPPVGQGILGFVLAGFAILVLTFIIGVENHPLREDSLLVTAFCDSLWPICICLSLTGRREQLSRELMLPMTRRSLVDGLFRAVAIETTWAAFTSFVLVIIIASLVNPNYFSLTNIAAVGLATLTILPLLFGLSFSVGLATSVLARILGAILTIGFVATAFLVVMGACTHDEFLLGIIISICIAGFGLATIQFARSEWMNAEFG